MSLKCAMAKLNGKTPPISGGRKPNVNAHGHTHGGRDDAGHVQQ